MKKYLIIFIITFFVAGSTACAKLVKPSPEKIQITKDTEKIQIVTGELNQEQYEYLGEVVGEGKAYDIKKAQKNARYDLKSQAFKLGASIVKLDTNTAGNANDFSGKTQVVLNGRAFKFRKDVAK